MPKITTLRIAGLTLSISPILILNPSVGDLSKGIVTGIGIGLLLVSLILQTKRLKGA